MWREDYFFDHLRIQYFLETDISETSNLIKNCSTVLKDCFNDAGYGQPTQPKHLRKQELYKNVNFIELAFIEGQRL
jgi:hypothetical protein